MVCAPVYEPAAGVAVGAIYTFATVTRCTVEVPRFPAASRAMTRTVCDPFGTENVSNVVVYGGAATARRFSLSMRKMMRETPMLSEAVAKRVTVPVTLREGGAREATGRSVSAGTEIATSFVHVPDPRAFETVIV